jgi:hypothetical protein
MNYRDLIPDIASWEEHNHCSFDPGEWVGAVGSFEHAIGYAFLFWPSFEPYDGCILASGYSEDSYRGFMDQLNGNKRAVEAVLNHVHIARLFSGVEVPPSRLQVVWLGNRLAEMWRAKLAFEFPGLAIVVSFNGDRMLENVDDYELTAFQRE